MAIRRQNLKKQKIKLERRGVMIIISACCLGGRRFKARPGWISSNLKERFFGIAIYIYLSFQLWCRTSHGVKSTVIKLRNLKSTRGLIWCGVLVCVLWRAPGGELKKSLNRMARSERVTQEEKGKRSLSESNTERIITNVIMKIT